MGSRKEYSSCDIVRTLGMNSEKSVEWAETVWVASLGLEKAFDRALQTAALSGSQEVGINEVAVRAIRKLHLAQYTYIELDGGTRSRTIQ